MPTKNVKDVLAAINPMVCYNSRIKMLNRMTSTLYDAAFKPFGITGNQFTLLLFVGKTKTTNQKMIADMLMINFSTVSRDLAKLSSAGWIDIEKGTDARNTQISLSQKGWEVLTKVLPVWAEVNKEMEQIFGGEASKGLDTMIELIKTRK